MLNSDFICETDNQDFFFCFHVNTRFRYIARWNDRDLKLHRDGLQCVWNAEILRSIVPSKYYLTVDEDVS